MPHNEAMTSGVVNIAPILFNKPNPCAGTPETENHEVMNVATMTRMPAMIARDLPALDPIVDHRFGLK